MNKKLLYTSYVLLALCLIGSFVTFDRVKQWQPYLNPVTSDESLYYSFEDKRYNELYRSVIVNETYDSSLSGELYDFAHYYNELALTHKDALLNKDIKAHLDKLDFYLNKISDKEILYRIAELNNIYDLENIATR